MKKLLLLSVAILALLSACGGKKAPFQMPAPEVSVAHPIVKDIVLSKRYPAYLTAEQTVNLVARVNGTLLSSRFKPGSRVKAGELLFVIEPTLYHDAVTQADANLKTAQAQLSYARSNLSRMMEAAKSDAVSRIQVLQAESSVAEAVASVSGCEAALNTARTNLTYCYVRAPFEGRIDRAQQDVGNYISGAAQPVTLATLYQDNRLYAYFNIADNQYLTLKAAAASTLSVKLPTPVVATIGTGGTTTYPGMLDYLSPGIDLSTGTLNVRAILDNPDGKLKSGLYMTITLPYANCQDALLVSDASIGTDQLGKYLYLVNDSNKVITAHITVGELVDDSLRQVVKGLTQKDRYVTTALLKVRDGMTITPLN